MRGEKFLIVFAALLILAPVISARTIESGHWCDEKDCLEGTDIHFDVRIVNDDDTGLVVREIYILDMSEIANGASSGDLARSKQAISDHAQEQARGFSPAVLDTAAGMKFSYHNPPADESVITSGETGEFRFYSMIQLAGSPFYIDYVPCYTADVFNNLGITGTETMCSEEIRRIDVFPGSAVECTYNVQCDESEFCNTDMHACQELPCGEGESAENHRCVPLICDAFSDIEGGECVFRQSRFYGAIVILAVLAVLIVYMIVTGMRK